MLCLSSFEVYSRWVPLVYIIEQQNKNKKLIRCYEIVML